MPSIDPRISVGNVIQIGLFLVMMGGAFFVLKSESQSAAKSLDDHEMRLRMLERDLLPGIARIEQRLIQIERGMH